MVDDSRNTKKKEIKMAATLDLGNLLVHLKADASQYMTMMKKVEGRMKMVSQRMTAIGGQMMRRVTLPLVAMGGASVKAFCFSACSFNVHR